MGGGLHHKWQGGAGNAVFMLLVLRTTSSVQCPLLLSGLLIPTCLPHFTTCQRVPSVYFHLPGVDACTLGYLGRASGKLPVRLVSDTMTSRCLSDNSATCEIVLLAHKEPGRLHFRGLAMACPGIIHEDVLQRRCGTRGKTGL
ncbi:hypothetical protein MRX96_046497 [Rhipicephalus microplus]